MRLLREVFDALIRSQHLLLRQFVKTEDRQDAVDKCFVATFESLIGLAWDCAAKQPVKIEMPIIPCSDGAGDVVAVGSMVTRVQPGDRVAASFFLTGIFEHP